MAWGLLLGGRRYDRIDYGCAVTVTAGCALFVLTGSIAAPQLEHARQAAAEVGGSVLQNTSPFVLAAAGATSAVGSSWLAYGLLLLGAFLLFDGLTSTTQDRLFAQYDMHSCNQLLWVSIWSAGMRCADAGGPQRALALCTILALLPASGCCCVCCCVQVAPTHTVAAAIVLSARRPPMRSKSLLCPCRCSLAFLVAGGQLWPAVSFVLRHPSALVYILMLSVVSTAVQVGTQRARSVGIAAAMAAGYCPCSACLLPTATWQFTRCAAAVVVALCLPRRTQGGDCPAPYALVPILRLSCQALVLRVPTLPPHPTPHMHTHTHKRILPTQPNPFPCPQPTHPPLLYPTLCSFSSSSPSSSTARCTLLSS